MATINSYLGLMIHYNTYNKRKKLISLFDRGWYKYIYVEGHFKKIVLRKQFRPIQKIKKQIKNGNHKQFFMLELELEVGSDTATSKRGLAVIYPDGAHHRRHIRNRGEIPPRGILPPPDA